MTIEALVPPKPNEFERVVLSGARRDALATMLSAMSSSGSRKLRFAGMSLIHSQEADHSLDGAGRA